jgi:hypothetical protein
LQQTNNDVLLGKIDITRGQANGTGVPHNQKVKKAEEPTYLYRLYALLLALTLPGVKLSSLFCRDVSDEEKKFSNIITRITNRGLHKGRLLRQTTHPIF